MKFFVFFIVVKRHNWNSIIKLKPERIYSIVHNDQIFKSSISNDAQVFDVELQIISCLIKKPILLWLNAMFSVKSLWYELFMRI